MSRVVSGDLSSMSSSSIVAILKQDASDAKKLESAIKSFVNGSSNSLKGPSYDSARQIMAQYIPILRARAKASSELASAIKSGCNQLKSYMSPYSILDEALRDEYLSKLKSAQATLDSLGSINWKDKNFNFFDYWETYFRCKQIISECTRYLNKLDGLPGADASSYGPIESAASSMPSL